MSCSLVRQTVAAVCSWRHNIQDKYTQRNIATISIMLVLCVVYAEFLLYTFLSELLVLIKQVYYSKPNLSDCNKLAYLRAKVAWDSNFGCNQLSQFGNLGIFIYKKNECILELWGRVDSWPSRTQCFKTFYVRNFRMFANSQSICPQQAFPAQSDVCK